MRPAPSGLAAALLIAGQQLGDHYLAERKWLQTVPKTYFGAIVARNGTMFRKL